MSKEYIERSFIKNLFKHYEEYPWTKDAILSEIKKRIEREPKADVVEVVRCKNCKHFDTDAFRRTVCVRDFQIICVKGDDFCSYGERKDK